MKILRHLALAAAVAGACVAAGAQTLTAAKAFVDAPRQVFPLLDRNAQLDMVDYFTSGMNNTTANAMNGQSAITSLDPMRISLRMTGSSDYEIDLLPTAKGDTLLMLISTVATPAPDSKMSIHSSDWQTDVTAPAFTRPTLKQWLTDKGRENIGEVEALVPFLLISYTYDPSTSVLKLTNNTRQFMSADLYEIVAPCLLPEQLYQWDGKKFTLKK